MRLSPSNMSLHAAILLFLLATPFHAAHSFQIGRGNAPSGVVRMIGRSKAAAAAAIIRETMRATALSATSDKQDGSNSDEDEDGGGGGGVEEYRNAATSVLSNFMNMDDDAAGKKNPIDAIDFDAAKFDKQVPLKTLAEILDAELYDREWFVTGNVNPVYFSDKFEFQDPDVKLKGIEEYSRGVYKLFDQETSRAEIISTVVNDTMADTITCTWRLSGKVNIGPGLTIKPYICYTDFTVDQSGLINFQEDRFDIPQWDILLSALFPFLVGRVTASPAPPAEPRVVQMPTVASSGKKGAEGSPFGKLLQMFGD